MPDEEFPGSANQKQSRPGHGPENHGIPQAGTATHSESEVAGNDDEEEEEEASETRETPI